MTQMYLFKLSTTVIVLLLTSLSFAGNKHCSQLVNSLIQPHFNAEEGRQIKNLDEANMITFSPVPMLSSDKIMYLGRGWHGYVFRIFEGNTTYILKIYKSKSDARSDLISLNILKRILSNSTLLKVPAVKKGPSESSIIIEDLKGDTLERISNLNTLNPSKIDTLHEKYIAGIRELAIRLQEFYGEKLSKYEEQKLYLERSEDDLPHLLYDLSTKSLKEPSNAAFLIDPKNIFVDHKTLDLYIIDPY